MCLDLFYSIVYTIKYSPEIYIGANNFDTFAGIILKTTNLTKIKKVIYFASDYSENRFKNPLLNAFYYFIEKICCNHSDLVVSNSKRAEAKRLKLGLKKERSVIVPNSALLKKPHFYNKEIYKNKFIYMGSITRDHGLLDLLKTIYKTVSKLVIIGYGEELESILNFCKSKKIEVELLNKKSHAFCIHYLQTFDGIGLAPYTHLSSWPYFCSPLKVFEYISSGCPVVMSSIPEIAEEVRNSKLGIVYTSLNEKIMLNSIKQFDTSNFSLKAKKFYENVNQNNVYSKITL